MDAKPIARAKRALSGPLEHFDLREANAVSISCRTTLYEKKTMYWSCLSIKGHKKHLSCSW